MRIIRQERGDKTHHQDAEFAVFTRLPGYFAALSRHYIAPSDCAVTNEKSPAYGSVCCCLCKARFLCGYRMEQFAFFRLMRLAPKYLQLFVLDKGSYILCLHCPQNGISGMIIPSIPPRPEIFRVFW
jgi:hypothetical protein